MDIENCIRIKTATAFAIDAGPSRICNHFILLSQNGLEQMYNGGRFLQNVDTLPIQKRNGKSFRYA